MHRESRPAWHTLREHITFWVIGGVLLALTGLAPEEWLARAIDRLHVPDNILHLWTAGIDVRVVPIAIGMTVIAIGLLRQRRVTAFASAAPSLGAPAGLAVMPPLHVADPAPSVAESPPGSGHQPPPLPDKPSIAVLPFTNLSGDPDQEYFSDGVVEDIIGALSQASWLFVIARNSSFTYKGRAVDVKQVGRELGVRYVLEGSVRKATGRVRITGQLIDAASGAHLWADHFDGSLENVFDLQDRVTESVAGAIEPRLQRAEIERTKNKPTASLDAYDYYLRGMASLHQATDESMRDAQDLFGKVLALDPAYGAAHGMAAQCVCYLKLNQSLVEPEKEVAEGVRLARLAVTAGRDDPIALWTGGHALAYLAGELDVGMTLVDRACSLNPNLAAAWSRAGWIQIWRGEPLAAIEKFQRSMRLNPLDPLLYSNLNGIGMAHFFAERYDEAAAWAQRSINERPNWLSALRIKAAAHALAGRTDEAQRTIAQLLRVRPGMRLSNVRDWMASYRRPADVERYLRGLRQAGLPE